MFKHILILNAIWIGSSSCSMAFNNDVSLRKLAQAVTLAAPSPSPLAPLPPAAPTLTASNPIGPTSVNTPLILGTSDSGTQVQLFLTSDCSGTAIGQGTESAFTATGLIVSALPDGTSTFYASASAGGLTSACSSGFTIVIDTAAPAAPTITSALPSNNVSPTIKGTAEAGSTVTLYSGAACSGSVIASGTATTWSGSGFTPSSPLADGTYGFSAKATDAAGNISACSSDAVYVLDKTAPPAPAINSVSPSSPSNNVSPTIKGAAEAGSTVTLYSGAACSGSVIASGTAATWSGSGFTPASALAEGTYVFTAKATDAAGNISACSTSFTYVLDTTSPVLPTFGSFTPASPSLSTAPVLTGTAEAGSSLSFYGDSGCTGSVLASGTASALASPGLTFSLANGTYTFYVKLTDTVGNASACLSTGLTYDSQAQRLAGFQISNLPSTWFYGLPVQVSLTGLDQFGSVYTGFSTGATVSGSDSTVIFTTSTTPTFTNGTATVTVSFTGLSSRSIRLTSNADPALYLDASTTIADEGSLALDTTFAPTKGYRFFNYSSTASSQPQDTFSTIAVGSDNKMFVTGYTFTGTYRDTMVARLNADGSFDTSFNTTGVVITRMGTNFNRGIGALIQADGKFVVAGTGRTTGANTSEDFAFARYNTNGTLDTSFNTTGIKLFDLSGNIDWAYAIAQQADGKIVATGIATVGGRTVVALARLTTAGAVDTTFGTSGKVTLAAIGTSSDFGRGIAIQPDGKIVVTGNATSGTVSQLLAIRFNSDGTLDTAFGTNGIAKLSDSRLTSSLGYFVGLQSSGKIVTGGYGTSGGKSTLVNTRFNTDGTLDTSYASNGIYIELAGPYGTGAYCGTVASDGSTVLSGWSVANSGSTEYEQVHVKLTAEGALDTTWGRGGKAYIKAFPETGYYSWYPLAVGVQSTGAIVSTGYVYKAAGLSAAAVDSDVYFMRLNTSF